MLLIFFRKNQLNVSYYFYYWIFIDFYPFKKQILFVKNNLIQHWIAFRIGLIRFSYFCSLLNNLFTWFCLFDFVYLINVTLSMNTYNSFKIKTNIFFTFDIEMIVMFLFLENPIPKLNCLLTVNTDTMLCYSIISMILFV